ncbi:hypothetical protein ABW21_db0201733 [Orbilia brochopaga]|nr:hypothetical protein ABW21_db0201733 [Drechslerella brochopaga]
MDPVHISHPALRHCTLPSTTPPDGEDTLPCCPPAARWNLETPPLLGLIVQSLKVAPSPISTSPSPSSSSLNRWKAVPDAPPPPPPPPKDDPKPPSHRSVAAAAAVGYPSTGLGGSRIDDTFVRPLPPPPPPKHLHSIPPQLPVFGSSPQSHDRYRDDYAPPAPYGHRHRPSDHRQPSYHPQVQEEVELEYIKRSRGHTRQPSNTDGMGRYEEDEESGGTDERERLFSGDQESASEELNRPETGRRYLGGLSRRAFGIALLLLVVTLWVTSSFLVSHIFTDDSYVKPYLVVYLSTSSFTVYLIPWGIKQLFKRPNVRRLFRLEPLRGGKSRLDTRYSRIDDAVEVDEEDTEPQGLHVKLSTRETMRLSAQFCLLWFVANWFAGACLEYTTVASTTILSATSSIFTLIFAALFKVERFSWAKVLAITVSMAGVVLISTADANSNKNDEQPSSTDAEPHHTVAETLLGDGMALFGALVYGLYTVLLKVRIGHESRVSMQLFFGFVGLFNFLCLWPGLIILHFTGYEKFELPPSTNVCIILLINCSITVVSDFCWVFAMIIPMALFGDTIISSLRPTWTYWLGACLVFGAFFVVNSSVKDEELLEVTGVAAAAGAGSAAVMDGDGEEDDRRRSRVFDRR